jgi:hypothetical protein
MKHKIKSLFSGRDNPCLQDAKKTKAALTLQKQNSTKLFINPKNQKQWQHSILILF